MIHFLNHYFGDCGTAIMFIVLFCVFLIFTVREFSVKRYSDSPKTAIKHSPIDLSVSIVTEKTKFDVQPEQRRELLVIISAVYNPAMKSAVVTLSNVTPEGAADLLRLSVLPKLNKLVKNKFWAGGKTETFTGMN
jgi:hypothetical protein